MSDSILGYHDTVGFCTLVETTASRLFIHGCDAAADTDGNGDLWFAVSIPRGDTAAFAHLRRVLDEHEKQSRLAPANSTPMLVELNADERRRLGLAKASRAR